MSESPRTPFPQPSELVEITARFHLARMEAFYSDASARLRVTAELGMLWIKSMLIISGGAVIGLFTLLRDGGPSLAVPSHLWTAFVLLSASICLTIAALLVGYLGQDWLQSAEQQSAEHEFDKCTEWDAGKVRPWPKSDWQGGATMAKTAVVIAVIAMLCQSGGFAFALSAFHIR